MAYTTRTFTSCVQCGAEKKATGSAYCPTCSRAYASLHRKLHKEHAAAYDAARHCEICGRQFVPGLNGMASAAKNMDVDHSLGTFRGVLCGKCNKALGWFDDDPEKLRGALEYLGKHQHLR
jgi:hypothetical protein